MFFIPTGNFHLVFWVWILLTIVLFFLLIPLNNFFGKKGYSMLGIPGLATVAGVLGFAFTALIGVFL